MSTGNIALRGNESQCSKNHGNFLRIVNLVAEFDPLLRSLIENDKQTIKYLSPLIQNEIISILSSEVKREILKDVAASPFFAIIADSTPDVNKTDQLSIILRYCKITENNKMDVVESFLGFFELEKQRAADFTKLILSVLKDSGIDIKKCRGQGYDGCATMSGTQNGVQANTTRITKNADFIHCVAHNLNLVICDAVKSSPRVGDFFDTIQAVYNFLHGSAPRWMKLRAILQDSNQTKNSHKQLKQEEKISVKRLCDTRWEARHNSVFAIKLKFGQVLRCLTEIILISKKPDEICIAQGLKKQLEKFEFLLLLVFWEKLLRPLKISSKQLQNSRCDLMDAQKLIKASLTELQCISSAYDEIYLEAESLANQFQVSNILQSKRTIKKKKFFDELSTDARLESKDPKSTIKSMIFEPVIQKALDQLTSRFESLALVCNRFAFLQPTTILEASEEFLKQESFKLHSIYQDDISSKIAEQILVFHACMKHEIKSLTSIKDIAILILQSDLTSSFPDLFSACLIFLTIKVTVASAERSFSKLKLIKSFIRNSMTQDRLSGLAMLNIESERAFKIDVDKLITEFAHKKARKRLIL